MYYLTLLKIIILLSCLFFKINLGYAEDFSTSFYMQAGFDNEMDVKIKGQLTFGVDLDNDLSFINNIYVNKENQIFISGEDELTMNFYLAYQNDYATLMAGFVNSVASKEFFNQKFYYDDSRFFNFVLFDDYKAQYLLNNDMLNNNEAFSVIAMTDIIDDTLYIGVSYTPNNTWYISSQDLPYKEKSLIDETIIFYTDLSIIGLGLNIGARQSIEGISDFDLHVEPSFYAGLHIDYMGINFYSNYMFLDSNNNSLDQLTGKQDANYHILQQGLIYNINIWSLGLQNNIHLVDDYTLKLQEFYILYQIDNHYHVQGNLAHLKETEGSDEYSILFAINYSYNR